MNKDLIKAEINRFNRSQRAALRRTFGERPITKLTIVETAPHGAFQVTVEFSGAAVHWFTIGPRGAINEHEFTRALAR